MWLSRFLLVNLAIFLSYFADMHENCPLWHCPLSDFYEVMMKNSIFVPSIYIHEKLIRFYYKIVPSKVMKENSNIVPSINFSLMVFGEE